MSQPMLLAQVEQAEAQLGQPLPADYRAFLLDNANKDTEEWGFFTTPKEFLYYELDWTKDFPFSLEHPVDDSPLKEFDKRAVYAKKMEHDSNKHNALCEEAFDYMVENFRKPMERGIVYVADEGCAMYSFLVLRGEAAGQVWWCELTSCFATIEPHLHPLTNKPISFAEWCFFESHYYCLTTARKYLPNLLQHYWAYPLDDKEGRIAMMSMLIDEKLTGMTKEEIENFTCADDVPEDAMFFDMFLNEWRPVRNSIVFRGLTMRRDS